METQNTTELARLVRDAEAATGRRVIAIETHKKIDNVHVTYRAELQADGNLEGGNRGGEE